MPKLNEWKKTYGAGVNFVAVHMPRQESDTDVATVKELAAKLDGR